MNIEQWIRQIMIQKDLFELNYEEVKGKREVDGQYELYYIDKSGKEEMLYVDKKLYSTFDYYLQKNGWKNVLVTKYLEPEGYPVFLLTAEREEKLMQINFFLLPTIELYGCVFDKNDFLIPLEETSDEFQLYFRTAYHYVLEYIHYRYNLPIRLEKNLYYFLENIPMEERYEREGLTAKKLRDMVWSQYNNFCINQETPQESTYKTIAHTEGLFRNAKYEAITYLSLIVINDTNIFQSEEEKKVLMDWLWHEYESAKTRLTEKQRVQIKEEGIDLI